MIIRWCERARFVPFRSVSCIWACWVCWLILLYIYFPFVLFSNFRFGCLVFDGLASKMIIIDMLFCRRRRRLCTIKWLVCVFVYLSMMSHRHCRSALTTIMMMASYYYYYYFCILSDSGFKIHGKSSSVKEIHSTHSFFNPAKKDRNEEEEREHQICTNQS